MSEKDRAREKNGQICPRLDGNDSEPLLFLLKKRERERTEVKDELDSVQWPWIRK